MGKHWLAVVVIKYGQPPTVIPVPKPNNPGSHSIWLAKNRTLPQRIKRCIAAKGGHFE